LTESQGACTRRSWLGLGLAIGAWSLSPLLIYESRGLADAPVLALYAVALGSLLTAISLCGSSSYRPTALLRTARKQAWLSEAALIGLGAFVVYPLLYFSAIQSGPPASVNLVNYLWPVVAVVVVSVCRPARRSLEIALAAGFGFAGAGLAITAGSGAGFAPDNAELYPFLLAALGALVYGGISGAISLRHSVNRPDGFALYASALLIGGCLSGALIGVLAILRPALISFDLSGHHPSALLAYATLLPVAHLSWMTAIRDPRVPAFSSAFLVPVLSTGILTLVVTGVAKPEVLSALVLVLCGITFASMHERGVPVGYAVALALLSSVQVSQVISDPGNEVLNLETGTIGQLLAAVTAVFAGFILSNAIQRNGALHAACSHFYARAAACSTDHPRGDIENELDQLDRAVIHQTLAVSEEEEVTSSTMHPQFASEWAEVDLAISNGVSGYEWLVLLVGGTSLVVALHVYAAGSSSAGVVALRAMGVALVVGILFAIRDYDRRRPQQLCRLLTAFRSRYGFDLKSGSPLAKRQEYWFAQTPLAIRIGLAVLVLVATGAIALNG
jgi:drug/metabolite transporter (DMT)-like permease